MDRSEWITWERCPKCGDRAAVGWSETGQFVDAVEFDCRNNCRLSIATIVRMFPSWGRGRRPSR